MTPRSSPGHYWALGSSWPIHRRPRVEWSGRGTPSRTAWSLRCASPAQLPLSFLDTIGGSASHRLSPTGPWCLPRKYLRTVANDNTVHFNGAALQVLPDGLRASYARATKSRFDWTAASWSSIRAGACGACKPVTSTLQRAVEEATPSLS